MEKYSFKKALDEAEKMTKKIDSKQASSYTEAGKQIDEEKKGEVDYYANIINETLDQIENLELLANKSVKIKLKGQDEIIFKSPRELFLLGPNQGESKNNKFIYNLSSNGLGSMIFPQCDLKYNDLSSGEGLATLNKELNMNNLLAVSGYDPVLNDFLEINESTTQPDIKIYDKELSKITDSNVSEKLRINYLYSKLIRSGGSNEDSANYVSVLMESDPLFVEKFFDFSIRACLTSGHEWSFGLFQLLTAKPELMKKIDSVHKNYSLPYLLERDFFGRYSKSSKPEEIQKLEDKIKNIFNALNIDIGIIRNELQETEPSREYMPGLETK